MIYSNIDRLKRDGKSTLIVLAAILLLAFFVLCLQSLKYASSLRVLLVFAYDIWEKFLWRILKTLIAWAILTGILFAIQFAIQPAVTNVKKFLSGLVAGFITGFIFPFFLTLILGISIFIFLGSFSLFFEGIIRYATVEFAWLMAAYLIFLWIAIDTPSLLLEGIKKGKWYIKFMSLLLLLLLIVQVILFCTEGLLIILNNSIMRTNIAFLLGIGVTLAVTIAACILFLKGYSLQAKIFSIVIVYLASVITGNVTEQLFHWGELPSALVAAFLAPPIYSRLARAIVNNKIRAACYLVSIYAGMLIGLLIDRLTKLSITGKGWDGILCGIAITVFIGAGFGLLYGPALSRLLINRFRFRPEAAFWLGFGLLIGIISGMILGGFITK